MRSYYPHCKYCLSPQPLKWLTTLQSLYFSSLSKALPMLESLSAFAGNHPHFHHCLSLRIFQGITHIGFTVFLPQLSAPFIQNIASLLTLAATDSRDDPSWLVARSVWNVNWQRPALKGIFITSFCSTHFKVLVMFDFIFRTHQIFQTHPSLHSQLLWSMIFALSPWIVAKVIIIYIKYKPVSPHSTYSATSWLQDSHYTYAKQLCVHVG